MQEQYLKIQENQYLSDTTMFQNGTPSDYIIFKKLPGLGATHCEALNNKRHSIILEPNTPVLEGKRDALKPDGAKLYPEILVVYKGVDKKQVSDYLKDDNIKIKKILCTPEAYISKVAPVVKESEFDIYNDFFMLMDESDKLVKDVDYRAEIVLPIDDFFKFKNKAMISATALVPSDRRFEDNGFKLLKVQPQYDYKKAITLINTNNILGALETITKEHADGEKVFIFINSVDLIHSIINLADISDKSRVYCADKSVKKLRDGGYCNASSQLGDFKQYNFLTSRFFSAVDIKINEKPHVVMVTHVFKAQYTKLDPYTDSIQIAGRLRNGVSSITHISNFSKKIQWKQPEEGIKLITDSYDAYKKIERTGKEVAKTEGGQKTLEQALKGTEIDLYVTEDDELNYFMLDNYLLEQRVNSYYTTKNRFNNAYHRTDYFLPVIKPLWFNIYDTQLLALEMKYIGTTSARKIATILHTNDLPVENGKIRFTFGRTNEVIKMEYPGIYEIYHTIGYKKMADLEFNNAKMKLECKKQKTIKGLTNPSMLAEIHALYKIGDSPLRKDVTKAIQKIYTKFGVAEKAKGSHIQKYYGAVINTDKENQKVCKITHIKSHEDVVLVAISKK